MDSINVKVAFCTECNGYYTATPDSGEDCNHPEIIDHYFYHGEPHFTLNRNSFEKNTQFLKTEIRTLKLSDHQAADHLHCNCLKEINSLKNVSDKKQKEHKISVVSEILEIDADIYFQDLYYTYNNFHGSNTSTSRSASA